MTIQSHYLRLLDTELEALQARIAELETTRRVILSLEPEQEQPAPKPEPKPKVRVKAGKAKSKTTARNDVIRFMETNPGPVKSAEVIAATGRPNHAVWAALSALANDGTLKRVAENGAYTYTLNREPPDDRVQ